MTAPIRSMPRPDELIATLRDVQDIVDVLRLMKQRLGLTNKFCDDALNMADGHTDKILGPAGEKNWGPTTLHGFMELFAIEFRVYVDMDAVRRMEQVWEAKVPRWFPNARVGRISNKIMEAARPRILSDFSALGNAARKAKLPGKHRSDIARKAAKSRWGKRRKRRAKRRCVAKDDGSATVRGCHQLAGHPLN